MLFLWSCPVLCITSDDNDINININKKNKNKKMKLSKNARLP